MLAFALVGALFITVLAAENPYDKFRNKEHSNKGYLTEEEEMKLAEDFHQELLKQMRLVGDRNVNNYINTLGQSLARRSQRPNIPWRFYVVDDKSINAFATLGGRVYLHTGLLAATNTEAQLASVVGHEIGHIVGRHGLENVKRAQRMQLGVGIAAVVGAVFGGQKGADYGAALGSLAAGGFLMKHSRDAEREADYLGLYNLQRAGYNPGGMVQMFEILNQISRSQPNALGSILSSHPPASERAANTRREIDERLRGADGRGVSNTNEFQRIKSNLPASSSPQKVRPRN
jgi:predicted Zn-dependent protease